MRTSIIKVETSDSFALAVREAVTQLEAGEVVALPTETVYGLAANALEARSVEKIFEIKGRPSFNPIIVHVASREQARSCVAAWSDEAELLAQKFWPGPLTLILPKSAKIPDVVTAGGATVGIRWPSHPLMQAVIQGCGFPLAAPSANLSNRISPTAAEHVLDQLDGKISLIIDAGASAVGIESTVVDLTVSPPKVLRPGIISQEEIEKIIRTARPNEEPVRETSGFKSPGLQRRHYAPLAEVRILRWHDEGELKQIVEKAGIPFAQVHVIAHDVIPENLPFARVSVIPHDAEAYARAIYAELHKADESKAKLILVEDVPAGSEWEGIRDRLRRASTK